MAKTRPIAGSTIALAELVKSTRERQNEYFRTRNKKVLAQAKQYEKALDAHVEHILGETPSES